MARRFRRTRRVASIIGRRRGGRFRRRGPGAGKGSGFLPGLLVQMAMPLAVQTAGPKLGPALALAAGGWWGGSDTLMTMAGMAAGQNLSGIVGNLGGGLGGLLGGGGGGQIQGATSWPGGSPGAWGTP